MSALYKYVAFSLPLHPCKKIQRAILCSASSGSMSGSPESWQKLVYQSDASDLDRLQARKRMVKRLQIAGVDQAELVDPWLLADADSRFAELHGVQIHYKIASATNEVEEQSRKESVLRQNDVLMKRDDVAEPYVSLSSSSSPPLSSSSSSTSERAGSKLSMPSTPESEPSLLPSPNIPAILLHGFGASLFSWERILKPLAKVLRSRAIAFDRPAFGLTSRINVPLVHPKNGKDALPSVPMNPYSVSFSSTATVAFIDLLQASKAVLIGHSAGCIIAADAYLKAPERIAALILVAPALFAPMVFNKKAHTKQEQSMLLKALSSVWAKVTWVFNKLGALIQIVLSSIRHLWYRILTAILRSDFGYWLIRIIMDKLSLQAVRMAWYDKKKIDDYVIAGYTKPLRCRNWERALLEYVIALAGDPSSNEEQLPLSQRLKEIECPVLVITGDSDVIVPAWNAERLSKVFPNGRCHVIKNCGHLPQEETPEEFLSVIQQFMQQVQQGLTKEKPLNETMVSMPA